MQRPTLNILLVMRERLITQTEKRIENINAILNYICECIYPYKENTLIYELIDDITNQRRIHIERFHIFYQLHEQNPEYPILQNIVHQCDMFINMVDLFNFNISILHWIDAHLIELGHDCIFNDEFEDDSFNCLEFFDYNFKFQVDDIEMLVNSCSLEY
jgi:hypothetical protein